jgi:hypothetical protein
MNANNRYNDIITWFGRSVVLFYEEEFDARGSRWRSDEICSG